MAIRFNFFLAAQSAIPPPPQEHATPFDPSSPRPPFSLTTLQNRQLTRPGHQAIYPAGNATLSLIHQFKQESSLRIKLLTSLVDNYIDPTKPLIRV